MYEKLRELIAKWRQSAIDKRSVYQNSHAQAAIHARAYAGVHEDCADQFEAALADCEPGQAPKNGYASYANHYAIEHPSTLLTFHSWKREQAADRKP